MTTQTWIYYALAVLVLTASPGPSSLLCMTKGVTVGWRSAASTALGSLSAISIIMTLSFTGLGVIIASSEWVFKLIKWAGAAYLIYLGITCLMSKQESYTKQKDLDQKPMGRKSHFLSGFIVGASNPKAIVFFTALFPQFIATDAPLLSQYLIFAGTFVVMELSWLLFYAYLGAKSSDWLLAKGRAKVFNRLTGGVFIGAGVLLSSTNRT